jgi:hypothetical protein
MDFQFDNGTGPLDSRSPFAQLSQKPQRFPQSNAKKRTMDAVVEAQDNAILTRDPAGTYSAFDSPAKSIASRPTSPSKPLPEIPAWNSMFSTPRKPNNDIDDSSAGETPRSPEQNNDSDATPDNSNLRSLKRPMAASMPALAGAERPASPTKERPRPEKRESWLSSQLIKAKNKWSSPGRGEIARIDHTSGMERRVEKRRKREISRKEHRRRRHSMSDTGDDDTDHNSNKYALSSPRKTSGTQHLHQNEQKQHWLSTFTNFIEAHPTAPHILSWWFQLLFNIFLLACCAYAIWSAWSAFSSDVDNKGHEAAAGVMAQMAVCAREYTKNNCAPATRMPALEAVCEEWGKCMNQDPYKVGRAKISAHTFGEIFNSFIEPISWKAMVFSAVLVFGCFALSNFAL